MKIPDFIGGGSEMGYESPITLIAGEIETKMENDTMQVIQRYGIEVDKEELIKALKYDRDQYDKGYRNGHIDGVLQGERPQSEWIWSPVADDGTVSGCCNKCSFSHMFIGGHTAQYNFCPNCGADMRGNNNE